MAVEAIAKEFEAGRLKFHFRFEFNLFKTALHCYFAGEFSSSAVLCAVLYERIFTTRLARELDRAPGWEASKDNVGDQLEFMRQREKEITEDKKAGFPKITEELEARGILTAEEKREHDQFYKHYRTPLLHGLNLRLFEQIYGRSPAHLFEIDVNDEMYRLASERLFERIGLLMQGGLLLKS